MRPNLHDSKTRRPWLKECCYHIHQRCVRNAKALKFSHQRDRFMRRLREMKDKYPVQVLNFLVDTDGYRLLLAADGYGGGPQIIQWLQSKTGKLVLKSDFKTVFRHKYMYVRSWVIYFLIMPEASRYFVKGHIYHLTHRCHNRAFLLKFARDGDTLGKSLNCDLNRSEF